ncbi:SusF/SusE family outer membrane protein [Prevotella sp. E9-3]|uniref:SusF/SusE family outer membrane protein n=1 Tax=Prevotella sp. E9-3 TaxID=2913621 RepID=UPI001EDC2A45|nr:SusF/SusE family outer membrane protein [Prevotella sp. E9-3]UKK49129.1 SusF/SusE family outer membrane protein [Prevotella sp. E9-3]
MKKILLIYVTAIAWAAQPLMAQDNLWATGSAVPGGIQQLVKRPDGQFRFSGPLNAGEVKIRTTEEYQQGTTRYLMPQLTDSYLINYGLKYSLTSDSAKAGWQVLFQEDTYRFIVNTSSQTVTGEVMLPWNEVLIAGSAFIGGSDNIEWKRDNMLPFVRDHENPYVFTWIGELGIYDNVIEPGHFKLEGQMTWGPRELHPYTDDEDPLNSTQVCLGGPDRKWFIRTPGKYKITVDLFAETFHAELLNGVNREETSGIEQVEKSAEKGTEVKAVYDLQGRSQQKLQRGLNIVRNADGTVKKVLKGY